MKEKIAWRIVAALVGAVAVALPLALGLPPVVVPVALCDAQHLADALREARKPSAS